VRRLLREDLRLAIAGGLGLALIAGAAAWDLIADHWWQHHALVTALVSNLLVVAVTAAVVNEVIDRRDRRRWNLLAQSVIFALLQSARATWTGLVELLQLGEVRSGSLEPLLSAAGLARDSARVSAAVRELLTDQERRQSLQRLAAALSDHASEVIARWAPVMVGARPYAATLDRHVELSERLGWINSVLAHNEPLDTADLRERVLTRSNIATERAEELGNDDWLHDQLLAIINLATELDYTAREQAYELVPLSWWAERTTGLAAEDAAAPPPPGADAA
jgi:hypothetical protein